MKEKQIYEVAETLLIVGGVNWGLTAFLDMNLVEMLDFVPYLREVVYGAVAASAVWLAWYKWMK